MSITESVLPTLEATVGDLGGCMGTGSGADDPARASCGRDLEVGTVLPLLDNLAALAKEMDKEIASGAAFNVIQLYKLRTVCTTFSAIHDQALGRLRDLEQAGARIDRAAEFRTRLREIHDVLAPIARILEDTEFSIPTQSSEQPPSDLPEPHDRLIPQPAPFDLPRPGTWTPVKTRPGPVRLPDPPTMPTEQPAPFDLPRPGTWVRVKARPGLVRLPDPIDD